MVDDFVDGAPVGKAAYGAVVDEEVGVELAGVDGRCVDFLAGIVGVDGDLIFRCIYITQYRLTHSRLQRPSRYRIHYCKRGIGFLLSKSFVLRSLIVK